MTIAPTVANHHERKGVSYGVIVHRPTGASLETAEAAHIAAEKLAKAVVLKDGHGYLAAVLPAFFDLKLTDARDLTGRRHLEMASESEIGALFQDCVPGAVPAVAAAYGLPLVWDDSLALMDPVYFEGGDHVHLVRVSGSDFAALMAGGDHGDIGREPF
jgi:Ala-tRNA(Pro) deacylase